MTSNGPKRSHGQVWVVPLFLCSRDAGAMSRHRSSLRDPAAVGEVPPDLYVVPGPWPRLGRPVKHDVAMWRVIDDWPAYVPVIDDEIDVFEAWFGDREVRIIGSKSNLLQTLTAAAGGKPATPGVRSAVLRWRMGWDSNPRGVTPWRFSRPLP